MVVILVRLLKKDHYFGRQLALGSSEELASSFVRVTSSCIIVCESNVVNLRSQKGIWELISSDAKDELKR